MVTTIDKHNGISPKLFEKIYAFPLWLRWKLYCLGIFQQKKLDRPVISIGGLMLGGVGKTPLTEHAARILSKAGFRVTILTRGYGRKTKRRIAITDGDGEWRETGDEPLLLSKRLPDIPIVVHPNRYESAELWLDKTDVFVMDDGFQHIKLFRDLDIVAISGDEFTSSVFPFGRRRDGLWRLESFDKKIIAINAAADFNSLPLSIDNNKVFRMKTIVDGFYPINNWSLVQPAEKLAGKKIFLAAGIANPGRFETSVAELGANIVGTKWFGDHKFHSTDKIDKVKKEADSKDSDITLVTMKDAVRLSDKNTDNFYALQTRIEIENMEAFAEILLDVAKQNCK